MTFSVSGIWMILLWFVFDIWGAVSGGQGVAYFAHIGGFAAGFGLAVLMLKVKWVEMERDEKSLLQMLGLDKKPALAEQRRDFAPWQRQWERSEREKAEPETVVPEPEKPKEEFIRFACSCGKRVTGNFSNALCTPIYRKIIPNPEYTAVWNWLKYSTKTLLNI